MRPAAGCCQLESIGDSQASIRWSARAGTIPTSNDIPGRFSTHFLRWREHCQVSAIPCELICGDRTIADGGQFATQELNWCAMFRRRKLKVDNSDPRTPLQGG